MASPLINATLQTAAEPLCNADCWSILRSPANETSVCNQPHWLPRAPCNEGAGSSWAWDVWARPNAPRHSLHCDGHTFKHSAMVTFTPARMRSCFNTLAAARGGDPHYRVLFIGDSGQSYIFQALLREWPSEPRVCGTNEAWLHGKILCGMQGWTNQQVMSGKVSSRTPMAADPINYASSQEMYNATSAIGGHSIDFFRLNWVSSRALTLTHDYAQWWLHRACSHTDSVREMLAKVKTPYDAVVLGLGHWEVGFTKFRKWRPGCVSSNEARVTCLADDFERGLNETVGLVRARWPLARLVLNSHTTYAGRLVNPAPDPMKDDGQNSEFWLAAMVQIAIRAARVASAYGAAFVDQHELANAHPLASTQDLWQQKPPGWHLLEPSEISFATAMLVLRALCAGVQHS